MLKILLASLLPVEILMTYPSLARDDLKSDDNSVPSKSYQIEIRY